MGECMIFLLSKLDKTRQDKTRYDKKNAMAYDEGVGLGVRGAVAVAVSTAAVPWPAVAQIQTNCQDAC